jgi:hypothetical protein
MAAGGGGQPNPIVTDDGVGGEDLLVTTAMR